MFSNPAITSKIRPTIGGSSALGKTFGYAADDNDTRLAKIGRELTNPQIDPIHIRRITQGFVLNAQYEDFIIKVSKKAAKRLFEESQRTEFNLRGRYDHTSNLYFQFPKIIVEAANEHVSDEFPNHDFFEQPEVRSFIEPEENGKICSGYYSQSLHSVNFNTHEHATYGRDNTDIIETLGHETFHHIEDTLAKAWLNGIPIPMGLEATAETMATAQTENAYIRGDKVGYDAYRAQLNERYAQLAQRTIADELNKNINQYQYL